MSRDLTREAESLKNLPVYGLHSASYRFLDVIPKENNASCLYSFSSGARPSLFSREHLEQSERVERSWRSVWLSASSVEKIRGMVTMELYFTHERRGFSSCETWKRHWGSTCYCYFTAVFYCRFCYDLVKQRNGSRRWIENLAIAERKLKKNVNFDQIRTYDRSFHGLFRSPCQIHADACTLISQSDAKPLPTGIQRFSWMMLHRKTVAVSC